jgi:hypothetical protein
MPVPDDMSARFNDESEGVDGTLSCASRFQTQPIYSGKMEIQNEQHYR